MSLQPSDTAKTGVTSKPPSSSSGASSPPPPSSTSSTNTNNENMNSNGGSGTTPPTTTTTSSTPPPPPPTTTTTAPPPPQGPSPLLVGKQFVKQYYQCLSSSPDSIHRFYKPSSVISHGLEATAPTTPVSLSTYLQTTTAPSRRPVDGSISPTNLSASAENIRDELFSWAVPSSDAPAVASAASSSSSTEASVGSNMNAAGGTLRFDFGRGAIDAQESVGGGILLVVTGHMTLPEDGWTRKPRPFVHTFFLSNGAPTGTRKKQFFVRNDVLRFMAEDLVEEEVEEEQVVVEETASEPEAQPVVEPESLAEEAEPEPDKTEVEEDDDDEDDDEDDEEDDEEEEVQGVEEDEIDNDDDDVDEEESSEPDLDPEPVEVPAAASLAPVEPEPESQPIPEPVIESTPVVEEEPEPEPVVDYSKSAEASLLDPSVALKVDEAEVSSKEDAISPPSHQALTSQDTGQRSRANRNDRRSSRQRTGRGSRGRGGGSSSPNDGDSNSRPDEDSVKALVEEEATQTSQTSSSVAPHSSRHHHRRDHHQQQQHHQHQQQHQQQQQQQQAPKPKPPGSWASLVAGGAVPPSPSHSTTSQQKMSDIGSGLDEFKSTDEGAKGEETSETPLDTLTTLSTPSMAPSVPDVDDKKHDGDYHARRGPPPPRQGSSRRMHSDREAREQARVPNATLFIKNVPDRTREPDIRSMFEPFATETGCRIQQITLVANRGFCFVDFESPDAVTAIVKTKEAYIASLSNGGGIDNPFVVHGRALEVERKVSDPNRRGSGRVGGDGGGGGGGGGRRPYRHRSASPGNGLHKGGGGGSRGYHRRSSPRGGGRDRHRGGGGGGGGAR